MPRLELTIDSGNAALSGDGWRHEVGRLVRDVANRVEDDHLAGSIRDINGNKVGEWVLTPS